MYKRVFSLFGILGPLVYVFTVILGAGLRSDYSHAANAISELTLSDSPNRALLCLLFSFYNICLILFGAGAASGFRKPRIFRVSAVLLALAGLFGGLMIVFPQDQRGAVTTGPGILHLLLAGLISPTTVVLVIFAGLGMRKLPGGASFAVYSFIAAALVSATGIVTAVSTGTRSPYFGLFERFAIGLFVSWVFVLALKLLKKPSGA